MKNSPTFPSQMLSNKPIGMPSTVTSTSTTVLNLNNSFLDGLGQIGNTSNRVPMNQMMATTKPTFTPTQPTQIQNSANSLTSFSPMIPNQLNTENKNGQEKTVSLSAQEINDFLS